MDTKNFIEKARQIHGDKYNYSKVNYINSVTKVCIICPEHGEFWQLPYNHLKGCGCNKCSIKKNTYNNIFFERSKKLYNDYYDYSKVDYINNHTKVCIICPKHGEFWITPNSFWKGKGCPICHGHKMDTGSFIEKAKQIHGDKYDYSKVEYISSATKVCIICPEHGEFLITPNRHLQGQGCGKCVGLGMSQAEFIEKAKQIHGDKYDYSKVNFINKTTKVCIICPEHGEFWQLPRKHLKGQGCGKCAKSIRKDNEEFINELKLLYGNKYKYDYVDYINCHTPVALECPKHGLVYRLPSGWLRGGGCQYCKCSISENTVEMLLNNNNINYIMQYMPKWLKSQQGFQQSVDFYLPDYNIVIECQGCQHFRPIEAFNGEEGFHKIIERDINKYNLCQQHNIDIIYYTNEHTLNNLLSIYENRLFTNLEELLIYIQNKQK